MEYVYRFVRRILQLFSCHILFRTKYHNLEIIEKYDKCLICPNHSRVFDPFYLYSKVPNMYSVAKSELFKNYFSRRFLEVHNVMPVKRDETDVAGTKRILKTLKNTDNIRLLIFPEGGIYKENYLEKQRNTRNGAVFISAYSNVPIIPIYMTSRPKFFSRIDITFGEPFVPDPKVLKDKELLHKESKRLIDTIFDMENIKYK